MAFLGYFVTLASFPRVCGSLDGALAKATDPETCWPPAELVSQQSQEVKGQLPELSLTFVSSCLSFQHIENV